MYYFFCFLLVQIIFVVVVVVVLNVLLDIRMGHFVLDIKTWCKSNYKVCLDKDVSANVHCHNEE